MPEEGYAQLPVKEATKKRIDYWGRKGQTYDEIVNQLLDIAENAKMDQLIAEKSGAE